MKKQIMSIAAAAALLTTGAMAFDYTYDGEIVTDITGEVATRIFSTYRGGVDANSTLQLSTDNKGDALIYPAFRAGQERNTEGNLVGDKWNSTIVVRNSKNAATVCKVVLYAADNSRELLDFDIYLSPYDVFRFNIGEDGILRTNDGSFAEIDETFRTNNHKFFTHNGPQKEIGNINHAKKAGEDDVTAGYAIVYAMVEATNLDPETGNKINNNNEFGAYHTDHSKLLQDFRVITDICRDEDQNLSDNTGDWRSILSRNSGSITNGTATDENVTAPNVSNTCLTDAIAARANGTPLDDNNATQNAIFAMDSRFDSPSNDLLFGDVTVSTASEGKDPRNLLLQATALDNYTADNQMMLWVPGEYAAIQDRRITTNMNIAVNPALGFANDARTGYSDYNLTGVRADSQTFIKERAYYTFDANENKGANTILLTQPTKRALIMANNRASDGNTRGYWVNGIAPISPMANVWGEFKVSSQYFDENENANQEEVKLSVVLSPVSSDPELAYKNELQKIEDPERTETVEDSTFSNSKENGFAIMNLGKSNLGLPAIVTQMTGSVIGDESQINWIYSTTTTTIQD